MMNIRVKILVLAFVCFEFAACVGKSNIQEHNSHSNDEMETSQMGNMLHLTKRDERYANIGIDTVKEKLISEYTTLLGTTTIDERKVTVITSRINGRVDQLFVKNPQQQLRAGQALFAIYSEELLSDENEFLNALKQQSQFATMKPAIDQLVEGARKKLVLWGLTREQISEIEKNEVASPLITYYSAVSGTVIGLNVSEGQYVEMGSPMFRIVDLSQLWVEAQVYADELKWFYQRPKTAIEFDAYPGKYYDGTPVFDNPSIEADQKISLVRFLVVNAGQQLRPGMMAYINVKRNEKKTLVIPKSAILIGNMTSVWVKTGEGMYENRMVQLGIQNKKEVEVINGLVNGDMIVTSGAYLLNSAWILKNGTGMPGMEGMKM